MINISEIRKLSVEDRIALVESIWDSIAEDTQPDGLAIPDAERAEILRRLQEFKAGDQKTYSWDDLKSYALEP
jgi:putative addiction module component (TIGR02574 family)